MDLSEKIAIVGAALPVRFAHVMQKVSRRKAEPSIFRSRSLASLAFLLSLLLLTSCHYQLPPIQPRNHRFPMEGGVVAPYKSLRYAAMERFELKEMLRQFDVPLRNRVLRLIIAKGEQRVAPAARKSAMHLLAERKNKKAIESILQWKATSRGNDLDKDFCLTKIDPGRFTLHALRDSFAAENVYRHDSVLLAGYLVRLGDPSLFAVVRTAILNDPKWIVREEAVRSLGYFWPFQGKKVEGGSLVDLFPLMRVALKDSNQYVTRAAFVQYEYAPRNPQLKQDLEQAMADSLNEYHYQMAKSILVYRYHRKEKDFPRDMRSYWSRKRRSFGLR